MAQGVVALLFVCAVGAVLLGSWMPLVCAVLVLISLAVAQNGPPG